MQRLQQSPDLMTEAEKTIRQSCAAASPGAATSDLVNAYASLRTEAQRRAMVAVLAARVATACFLSA